MDMRMALLHAHEVFLSARGAGFTRGQALYLAACVLCGGPRPPQVGE
jgi:cytochrome c